MRPLSRSQVRQVDQIAIDQYAMPGIILMENAGRGAAEEIHALAPSGDVVILGGKGNNGGDGYVIARHLQTYGHSVQILSVVDLDQLSGDGKTNATIAKLAGIPISVVSETDDLQAYFSSAAVIVDALLGTGASPPVKGSMAVLVSAANQVAAVRIALDVPTGMDADSGEVSDPTFRADHTMTFVAPKIGFNHPAAASYVGTVHVISIGIPRVLLTEIMGDED